MTKFRYAHVSPDQGGLSQDLVSHHAPDLNRKEYLIEGKNINLAYTYDSYIIATAPATSKAAVTNGFAATAAAVLSEVLVPVVDAGRPDATVFEVTAAVVAGNADD